MRADAAAPRETGTATPPADDRWLEVARAIGRRTAGAALWDGDRCTWEVEVTDPASDGTRTEVAGGNLYQGTAGIALFLGELAATTADPRVTRTALGAVRHALDQAAAMPPNRFAFHGGRVGNAWVATHLGRLLERPELARRAAGVLAPLAGHESADRGLDVIAGAAGAIPALLDLARWLHREDLVEMALGLGDRLIAAARREPAGWSWGTTGPSATRNLTGYAHGASGMAVALLELARASGRGRYRFAAEMAFLYERRLYDPELGNWPDLRHRELNLLYHSGDPDAVRRADAAGEIPPFRPAAMTAWCHGAPGIGLARLRAWELTGRQAYRREAEAALATTLESLGPPPELNYSLCHGVAGNCALPLYAGELLADPEAAAAVHACAEHGWRSFEAAGRPWPCGTVTGVPDPSLMLGEGGVGWFYLHLARPELPSVLIPRPRHGEPAAEDDGFEALAEEWLDGCFGTARRAFDALGAAARRSWREPAGGPLERSPAEEEYARLCAAVEGAGGDLRPLLADAFRVERARHELTAEPNDLTAEFLRRVRREAGPGWEHGVLAPAPELRLLTTRHDWPAWLRDDGQGAAPPQGPAHWLLCRLGERVITRPLGDLAAAVLAALDPPATAERVVERVAAAAGGADTADLAAPVRGQLESLYRAGLLDVRAPRKPDQRDRKKGATAADAAAAHEENGGRGVHRGSPGEGLQPPSNTPERRTT